RRALAPARGLRPARRRHRPGDHLERPRPGAVPQRRHDRAAPGRHPGPRRRWTHRRRPLSPTPATPEPLPADTPARGAFAPNGVFKRGWAGVFFASGRSARPPPGTVLACGGVIPAVCPAYTEAATTGRISPATAALLARSSPASVTDRIMAPTLLVQGEQG